MAEGFGADELCNASARGQLEEVVGLLRNGADINGFNKFNRTPLQVVMLGNSELIGVLLEAGADPNLRDPVLNLTLTHDVAREGFADSLRALLDKKADVNLVDEKGNLPLHLAAREGRLEVVQLLMGVTADPMAANSLGQTPLQLAQDFNRTDVANYIQEHMETSY